MKAFVVRQNIQRYREQLEVATDERRRRVLLDLLAEEEAKLAELVAQSRKEDEE